MKKFEAGKYYIGDLCYVVKNEGAWDKLLEDTNHFKKENQTYKGCPIFAHSTALGDGEYFDQEDRRYLVDGGIIGIMPFEVMEGVGYGGHILDINRNFEVNYNEGIFTFDNIVIDTRMWDNENSQSEGSEVDIDFNAEINLLKVNGETELYNELHGEKNDLVYTGFERVTTHLLENSLDDIDCEAEIIAEDVVDQLVTTLYTSNLFTKERIISELRDGTHIERRMYWADVILCMSIDFVLELYEEWDSEDNENGIA